VAEALRFPRPRAPVQLPSRRNPRLLPIQRAKVPIFSGLTESELSFLAQRAVQRHYSTGESVFGEGEACSGPYVVESGPAIGARPGAGVTVASFVNHLALGPARELAEDLHSRGLQRVCAIRSGSVERTNHFALEFIGAAFSD